VPEDFRNFGKENACGLIQDLSISTAFKGRADLWVYSDVSSRVSLS